MPTFEVTLRDRSVESIAAADAYQQEGPMTTFFRLGPDRRVVDSWSERVASVRTADILVVRRQDEAPTSHATDSGPSLGIEPGARPGADVALWAVS